MLNGVIKNIFYFILFCILCMLFINCFKCNFDEHRKINKLIHSKAPLSQRSPGGKTAENLEKCTLS